MLFGIVLVIKFIIVLLIILISSIILAAFIYRFGIEPLKKGRCTCKTKLNGKIAIVTGGNSGIGFETALELAKHGANVIIASRNINKSEEAVNIIKKKSGNSNVEYEYLDLSKFTSVVKFVNNFLQTHNRLDILVNNAGCAGLKNRLTEDGIDIVVQINYVAPFLLTKLLINKLIECKPSRIVNVSSYLHNHANLDPNDVAGKNLKGGFIPYNNSKLCIILWTKALAEKLPKEVVVNVTHPGAVKTNIFSTLPPLTKKIWLLILSCLFKNAEEGAQTIIHLCLSPNIITSGDYYVDCKKFKHAKQALDRDLIEKVWNETNKLVTTVNTDM